VCDRPTRNLTATPLAVVRSIVSRSAANSESTSTPATRRLTSPAEVAASPARRPESDPWAAGDGFPTTPVLLSLTTAEARIIDSAPSTPATRAGSTTLQVSRWAVDDGAGGDWVRARRICPCWLTGPLIRERYFVHSTPSRMIPWSADDAIALLSLPKSEPEDFGPCLSQRHQRAVSPRTKRDEPGRPPRDTVTPVRVGAMFRQYVVDAVLGRTSHASSGLPRLPLRV
jgi:hypothetical protein